MAYSIRAAPAMTCAFVTNRLPSMKKPDPIASGTPAASNVRISTTEPDVFAKILRASLAPQEVEMNNWSVSSIGRAWSLHMEPLKALQKSERVIRLLLWPWAEGRRDAGIILINIE